MSAVLAASALTLLAGSAGSAPPQSKAAATRKPAKRAATKKTAAVDLRPIPSEAGGPPDKISVTFSNVDVREVLGAIAQYAHADLVVTPGAKGSLSLNLQQQTPDQAIRLVAAAAGLTVLKAGNSYVVGPPADVRAAAAELGKSVTVPLRFLSPMQAKEALSRAAPTVTVEVAGQSLVLSGFPEAVEAAQAALTTLDVKAPEPPVTPPRVERDLAALQFADPEAVVGVLKQAFPEMRVIRENRTLILVGVQTDLEAAKRAIKSIDVEPPKEAPVPEKQAMFVYRLQYIDAHRAEEALKKIVPALTIAAAPEAVSVPPADFRPLNITGGNREGGGLFGGGGLGSSGLGTGGTNTPMAAGAPTFNRVTRLILVGSAGDLETAKHILNETDVAPAQVQIQAELMEVDLTKARNLGVQWDFSPLDTQFTFSSGGFLRFGTVTNATAGFRATVQALIQEDRLHLLARPNIAAIDNEDAWVFLGDQRRFFGDIAANNTSTFQQTDTINVGITLLVRPRIHPNGDITLKVHPSVSSITSFDQGLPQTASREADTTVRLAPGDALVIGGLKRNQTTIGTRKVPGFGDIPLLGQFFRSRTQRKENSEIIIVIQVKAVEQAPPGRESALPPARGQG